MLGALDMPDVPTGVLGVTLGGGVVVGGGVVGGGVLGGGVVVGGVVVGGVVVGGVVVGGVVVGGVVVGGVVVGGVADGGLADGGCDVGDAGVLLPALPITGFARTNSPPVVAAAPPPDPDWRQPVTVTACWLPAALCDSGACAMTAAALTTHAAANAM